MKNQQVKTFDLILELAPRPNFQFLPNFLSSYFSILGMSWRNDQKKPFF